MSPLRTAGLTVGIGLLLFGCGRRADTPQGAPRPADLSRSRTANMTVIVALGDSTTAGTPFFKSPLEAPPDGRGDERGAYAHWILQRQPTWQVLNRGVNGERSDEIAARFDRDVLGATPGLVVILAGVNDVYQGRSVAHVTTELRGMYDRAASAKIAVIAGSIVPYNSATPAQVAAMHAINDWIAAEAARDPNLSWVDTRAAAAAPGDIDRLRGSPDGLHPDIDGYRRMGEAIEAEIRRVLAKNSSTI
jgi:lysophospholipase L1-like esterase